MAYQSASNFLRSTFCYLFLATLSQLAMASEYPYTATHCSNIQNPYVTVCHEAIVPTNVFPVASSASSLSNTQHLLWQTIVVVIAMTLEFARLALSIMLLATSAQPDKATEVFPTASDSGASLGSGRHILWEL